VFEGGNEIPNNYCIKHEIIVNTNAIPHLFVPISFYMENVYIPNMYLYL
jgi:hypothetical protein